LDAAGNRTAESRALGFARSWTYLPWGGLHSATDADGIRTTYEYDVRGRRTAEVDANHGRTEHAFDGVGNRIATTRPEQGTWSYGFDAGDRLRQVQSPSGAITRYEVDAHGNR